MSRIAVPQLAAALGAAFVVLGLLECKPGTPGTTVAGRPECPRDSIFVPGDPTYKQVAVIAGSGPISLVPEYHDCQRMLTNKKTAYGPLIAIFVRNGLDTMSEAPAPQTQSNREVKFAAEQAAATILNYDGPYDPLRIEAGFNCLYVYSTLGSWKAHIVKANTDQDCLQPLSATTGGTDLNVRAIPDKNVPPVARWDWDDRRKEQYIGMRCGTRWCEVFNPSNTDLVSSPTYTGPLTVSVKGWYDEQVLAVNGSTGPDLVPGGVVGTIFPIGKLDQNSEEDFKAWKPVARVSLSASSPAYKNKFNFVVGPAPGAQSEVSLCKGSRNSCGIPATADVNPCDQKGDPWWARIVSGPDTKYRCVIRREHSNVPIPGVVRWRWQTKDDDMWIRCPTGCCEVT